MQQPIIKEYNGQTYVRCDTKSCHNYTLPDIKHCNYHKTKKPDYHKCVGSHSVKNLGPDHIGVPIDFVTLTPKLEEFLVIHPYITITIKINTTEKNIGKEIIFHAFTAFRKHYIQSTEEIIMIHLGQEKKYPNPSFLVKDTFDELHIETDFSEYL